MSRRSLLTHAEADIVLKAHNCQASKHHRLERGAVRLKVKKGRSFEHYCLDCARSILIHDSQTLAELLRKLSASADIPSATSVDAAAPASE